MLVVGAANYVVSVEWAVWFIVPLCAVGSWHLSQPAVSFTDDNVVTKQAQWQPTGVPIAISIVTTTWLVWYLVSQRWAIGLLQTDVMDTFNLTALFWGESARSASTDFGNGFRLLDYSARAATWGPFLERPSDAVVLMRLAGFALLAALLAGYCARTGHRRWIQVLCAVLVCGSASFTSLYAEGYMTREVFVTWTLIGLLVIAHQILDAKRDASAWWCVGTVCVVPLAMVPPYWVIGPALVLALLGSTRLRVVRDAFDLWKSSLLGFLAAFIALGIPNLVWLKNVSDAERYVESLNLLVRYTGIPLCDSPLAG